MSEPRKPRSIRIATATVLALSLSTFAMIFAGGPDLLLSRGYGRALADVETAWDRRLTGNLWLSDAPADSDSLQNQPLRHALSVGDRIKISNRSGTEETIEVVTLEQVDGLGLGLAGMSFQVVTGRGVGQDASETVRFLFAVDTPSTPPFPAKVDRSL